MSYSAGDFYAPGSRIKSKRRRRRLLKKDRDSQLLAIFREMKAIDQAQEKLGFEPLVPPVQRGWKRTFVLCRDVANSEDAEFFQALLDRINTTQYSKREDFKEKKKRNGKKIYVDTPQYPGVMYAWQFAKYGFTEKQLSFFRKSEAFYAGRNLRVQWYEFSEPWRFTLKVEPNMITKVRLSSQLLDQRKAELEMYMKKDGLDNRLWRLLDSSNRKWFKKYRTKGKYQCLDKQESIRNLKKELDFCFS